jgi:hypothetical protein
MRYSDTGNLFKARGCKLVQMTRLLCLSALVGLLCFPLEIRGQYQVVELADVRLAKSLSAVVQEPTGSALTKVLVEEFSPDWKTLLRTTVTDKHRRFSLATVQGRNIYCLQLSSPGFDPLRVRIQVNRKRGGNLELKLVIAT